MAMAMAEKENLESEANEALKNKALDYLRKYASDAEMLKQNREDALKAYRRDPYPEDAKIPEGSRSKFVMSDVSDTIESIMPSLMRVFTSGKEVVKIEGQGPEDESRVVPGPQGQPITINPAELLNQKVNWDLTRQNNGFLLFYDWFKASMLNKYSVVKYWWEVKDEYKQVKFREPLTDQGYKELLANPKFIETRHKEVEIQAEIVVGNEDPEMGPMMLEPRVVQHEVEGKLLKRRIRRPRAEVVPPEEFICSLKTRNLKDEDFVAHRKRIHKVDLMRDYKVKEDDLEQESQIFSDGDQEIYERFKDLGGIGFFRDEEDTDYYYIYECCMKEDVDDERVPIILTIMGSRTIEKKENSYGHPNYCMNSPIRMPHRAIGMSVYDLVGDIQKLRTALARYNFNNVYYQTEGMLIVNPWKINVADFVTQRRPGGVVRTKESNVNINEAAWPVPVQPLSGHAVGLLETVDGWSQKRTGVTSYNQGLDADSLNKTARGISEIMAAAQQRVELIARIYAETGVRDLMNAFAEMNIEFLDMETNIRLDQQWAGVTQDSIDILFDVSVDVALGTGSRELKVQQIMGMLDRSLNPLMIQSGVIQRENIYELLKTGYVEMGYKNYDKYLTNPATLQPLLPPGGAPPNGQPVNGAMGGRPGIAGPPAPGVPPGSPMVQ